MTINFRQVDDYATEVRSVIIEGEDFSRSVYDDGVNHIPTVGYGYALVVNGANEWEVKGTLSDDLESLGITLSLEDQLSLGEIVAALNGELEATPEDIMDGYEFDLTVDEDEANTLFGLERARTENAIEDQLARHVGRERASEIFDNLSDTHELVALTSLAYTNYTLIGSGLSSALDEGNRAEAWYEIRYASNGGNDAGIAKRRYHESHIFGLYNEGVDAETITDDQARQVYRMFNRHREDILDYESRYGVNPDGSDGNRNMIAEANNDYSPDTDIPTLEEALFPASEYLMEEYAASLDAELSETISFENIWVDRLDNNGDSQGAGDGVPTMSGGDENDLLVGSDSGADLEGGSGNDILWGGDENDTLKGGAGDDWLVGGEGQDTLEGGAGFDTYVYDGGDGTGIIKDSDGDGRIIVNGNELADGERGENDYWEAGNGVRYYLSEDSEGTKNLKVAQGTSEILRILDWNDGDLGIQLHYVEGEAEEEEREDYRASG